MPRTSCACANCAADEWAGNTCRINPAFLRRRCGPDWRRSTSIGRAAQCARQPDGSLDVLERAVHIAGTAPSGAHKQPWSFCLVTDSTLRKRIRRAVEEEEYKSYHGRMSQQWLDDLEPLGTDHVKPFIEEAPALIIVFRKVYERDADTGGKNPNYYVQESCGIAVGLLLAALRSGAGRVDPHPLADELIAELLERPENERAFLNIPWLAWMTPPCRTFLRKPLNEISFNTRRTKSSGQSAGLKGLCRFPPWC